MDYLRLLNQIASKNLQRNAFNSNFKKVSLHSVESAVTAPIVIGDRAFDLSAVAQSNDLNTIDITFIVSDGRSILIVLSDGGESRRVTYNGNSFLMYPKQPYRLTLSRIQAMYYDDVRDVTNHVKRASPTGTTLTLDQILYRYKSLRNLT